MDEILEILEDNARVSHREIADTTDLDEEQVKKKIDEYLESGVIKKFKTVIDWEGAGEEKVYAIVDVKISPERGKGYDLIAKKISNFPQIKEVYLLSGEYDLSVLVEGENMKEIAFFISDKLATIDRVYHTTTHFILKKYKEHGEILFEKERNHRQVVSP